MKKNNKLNQIQTILKYEFETPKIEQILHIFCLFVS